MTAAAANVWKRLTLLLIPFCLIKLSTGGALVLNQQNFNTVLASHELVIVNYYANWCRFSQMLEPIFDEFADKLSKEIPNLNAAAGKVDCDVETTIASNNQINKYPTIKIYRYGTATKREYRGQRSADAFLSFVKEQLENPTKIAKSLYDYQSALAEIKKRVIVGFFTNEQSPHLNLFLKMASILRDSCKFIATLGVEQTEKIVFKENLDTTELLFEGDLNSYEMIYAWANEKCTPLVREITFENAEELTEEGLPFLILFHKPEDMDSVHIYEKEVKRQISHLKHAINSVYADGNKFSHPLHHLGKTVSDLPLIAIDSFRHMYLFPDFKQLGEGNRLLEFVQDLHSGKLHREYHNGPDPTTPPTPDTPKIEQQIDLNAQHVPKTPQQDEQPEKPSTPPDSVFIKLAPSRDRYSLKNDEL